MTKKRIIIIDGNSLVHRAYHALPPLTAKGGELVNAVYGFFSILFKAIKDWQPDCLIAAFDLPKPTFRHKEFSEYKANRPKLGEDFYLQIPRVKEILSAMGIPVFEKEGFEADDLIGTISKEITADNSFGLEAIILSGDLDNLQLVNKKVKVLTPKKGLGEAVLYDEGLVSQRYLGLSPSQLPDFKALKGDPSDNFPGVKGIGEKTAIKLIGEFGSVENLYRVIKEGKFLDGRLGEKLKNTEEIAFLSKKLATIDQNAPIDFSLERCWWDRKGLKNARRYFEALGFSSLLKRLDSLS